ncbi:MAG: hypothetical protein V1831_00525 [Candidatus Woesearchaeota archaeon]
MKDIKNHLIEKGWNKKDINKTIKIIEHAKRNKHPTIKFLDKSVYWLSLLLAIIKNFIISLALIPVIIVFNAPQLYIIIAIIGIAFGLLFELLIRSIEHLEAKHHIFLSILIPVITVINFVIVLNNMKKLVGIEDPQNPIVVGVVYAVSFILPYITYQLFLKNR